MHRWIIVVICCRETNNLPSSAHVEHAPSNGIDKIGATTKPSDVDSDYLPDDYETDAGINTVSSCSLQ